MNVVIPCCANWENISWATSRAQCKLDQFAHVTKMAAEDRAAAACIVIAARKRLDKEKKRETSVPKYSHNWLIRGVSKSIYMPQSLVDHIEPTGEIVLSILIYTLPC